MSAKTAILSTPFCAIGVDVGGTKIAAGTVQFPEGEVQARRLLRSRPERGGHIVFAEVEEVISQLALEAQSAGLTVGGIGVGLCEIVDRAGVVRSAQSVAWPVAEADRKFTRIAPVVMEADVRAAARAEALFGAGRGVDIFLYFSIGTGISSCLVIDGEPFYGARGATGSMASGLLPIFTEGPKEDDELTLEQIASGPALVTRFREWHGRADSAQEVLAAAESGDEQAARVVESGAKALGGSLGALVNVLDPALVILGGGLGLREGYYRNVLVAAARHHIWWEGHRDLPIMSAVTGPDAGIIGAAATAWSQLDGRGRTRE